MKLFVASFLLVLSSLSAFGQADKEPANQLRGVNVADSEVVAGLKQALALSALDAIKVAGMENGFASDNSIKLFMPAQMKDLELELRRGGNGLKIDEFELSMNRAAEISSRASSLAFAKAIGGLNFADPRVVLNGSDTAATDYLARNASAELIKSLRPIVEAAMNKNNVTQDYNTLFIQVKGVTMGEATGIDITDYMVRKTLDSLLFAIGREEQKIRTDPQGQASPILKEVFSKR